MVKELLKKIKKIYVLAKWKVRGCPVPPPDYYKIDEVTKYGKKYGCNILIETGTYHGGMINAQWQHFDYIASVELSIELYQKAKTRFINCENIHLYQGDSGEKVFNMIKDLPSKDGVLFWLDSHYSGGITARGDIDTPVIHELETIFNMMEHCVILIDDARCFVGKNGYPRVESLLDYVSSKKESVQMSVRNDIIRILV